jgi:hypothetical protein
MMHGGRSKQSNGLPSKIFVPMEIGENAGGARVRKQNARCAVLEDNGILIRSGLESCPAPPKRQSTKHPLLWFQVDGILRDLIEGGHSFRIGLKSTLRHDKIRELRGNVHIGRLQGTAR